MHCVLCDARIPSIGFLCQACSRDPTGEYKRMPHVRSPVAGEYDLRYLPATPATLWILLRSYRYAFPVDVLIKAIKFSQRLAYAELVARLMYQQIARLQTDLPECLIPIPLHWKRLFNRGYNQAVELAKPLAECLGIPLLHDAAVRTRTTIPQARLAANARRRNVRRAFQLNQPVRYQHVALVDDVMTTGHTASELAVLLRSEGVGRVDVWVAARAYR